MLNNYSTTFTSTVSNRFQDWRRWTVSLYARFFLENLSGLTYYLHYRKIIRPSNIVLNDSHFAFRTRIIFLIWFWRHSDSSSASQSQCLTFPTLLWLCRSWYILTSSWVLYFVKCCIFWSALVLCLISYHNNLMTLGKSFLSCVL